MGWVELIKDQVANGFDILDDLVADVTWTQVTGSPVFSDGQYTYPTTQQVVGGVLTSFNSRLIDNDKIQTHDRELLVKADDVSGLTSDDKFTVQGRAYQVLDFGTDPAGATVTIHLRPV